MGGDQVRGSVRVNDWSQRCVCGKYGHITVIRFNMGSVMGCRVIY